MANLKRFVRYLFTPNTLIAVDPEEVEFKNYFSEEDFETEFVGFVDILGFSKTVTTDFVNTLKKYNNFINHVKVFGNHEAKDLRIRVLSDSIILTSKYFPDVVIGTNLLLHGTLAADFLTRGGIATGRHIDATEDENYYMVSEALVKAVNIEKSIKYPCVALHEDLYPTELDPTTFPDNRFLWKLLYYDDKWIVNPFNIMWGTSAATCVKQLKKKYPEYSAKYDWFLGLFNAVWNREELFPVD